MESNDEEELQPIQSNSKTNGSNNKCYTSSKGDQFGYSSLEGRLTEESNAESKDFGCCGPMDTMKRFLIFSVVLTSTILVVFISLYIWKENIQRNNQVCIHDHCIRSSAFILNMMDQKIDPCDDLYSFSCDRWIQANNATLRAPKLTVLQYMQFHLQDEIGNILTRSTSTQNGKTVKAIKKALLYFKNCQNETDIEHQGTAPIKKMIAKLGGWNIENGNWSEENSWNLRKALVYNQQLGGSAFFTISVENSDWDSNSTVLTFMQAGLTLKSKDAYNKTSSVKLFKNYVRKIAILLGETELSHSKISEVYHLEKKLASLHMRKEELIDPIKTSNRMRLSELSKMVGNKINFTQLVNELQDYPLKNDVEIVVASIDFFKRLESLLENTPTEVLANYIVLNTIQVMSMFMPHGFIKAYLNIFDSGPDLKNIDSRWKHCVGAVKSAFPLPLASLYALKNFPISSKREVERMFEEIRESFIESVPKLDWMDDPTKAQAIAKAKAMKVVIGFPEWILNWDLLDEFHEDMNIIPNNYFENEVKLRVAKCHKIMEYLNMPFDIKNFVFDALDVNAFYNSKNFAIFPAGLLQRPMYDVIFPLSYNFGALGSAIGHEFIHGFDNSGRRFNSEGILHNWWTNISNHKFEKKAKCIQDQYSNYNETGRTMDGLFSLGENIADNGGLQIAYRAYEKRKRSLERPLKLAPGLNLTHDQIFFLGFSQHWCTVYKTLHEQKKDLKWKHAPGMLRVKGSVSNMKTFSDVFHCSPTAKLNPPNKCTFW